ncbi:MAG TPA: hypothetical protein VNZ61_25420 [Roseomonas sp.]|nr:hypothetical protein [Roseomonas sp.]
MVGDVSRATTARGERFLAWLAMHRLKADPSLQEAGLNLAHVEHFGHGYRSLPGRSAEAWAQAWKVSLREQGEGRIRWQAYHELPSQTPFRRDASLYDMASGLRLLLGSPLRQVALLPLRDPSRERRLVIGPDGDWVLFCQAKLLEGMGADAPPVERVWYAEGPTLDLDAIDEAVLDQIADGWRPVGQAELQLDADAAQAGLPEKPGMGIPVAPSMDGIRGFKRALGMGKRTRPCLTPEDLDGAPGRYPPLLASTAAELLLGVAARKGGEASRGYLRLLPDMTCQEVVEALDGLFGSTWSLGAFTAGGLVPLPGAVVCCPGHRVPWAILEPDWDDRTRCARFDKLPGVPSLPHTEVAQIRQGDMPSLSLQSRLVARSTVMEALATLLQLPSWSDGSH